MIKERIQAIQRALGVEDDGDIGNETLTALEKRLSLPVEAKGAGGAGANSLGSLLIEIAASQLGVTETSKNQGPGIAKFWTATNYPEGYKDRAAWCAAFVCWVFMETGKRVSLAFDRPQTAAAFGFEDWAREEGQKLVKGPSSVKRGEVIIYSFSHIGIAASDSDSKGNFDAIEGNTNGAGEREGGTVMRKRRNLSAVRSLVRL
ncbi:CHAP domain-containing protein [Haloferula sp. BvORR071]|uniref:CHAP domain-containing protein n=1 Tax=Haloferula sp. BvORR071 TaxID=1396141 RepID=UPI000555341A|nr:CHAP domain-containing protein [Haloferula sp. BvORR071]